MAEGIKVLIAEDEFLVALDIKTELKRLGYAVCDPVASGGDAIVTACRERPDVILMDVNLASEIDGIAAARAIRAEYDPFIIFMTGLDDAGMQEHIKAMDRARYVAKPVSVREIEGIIRSIINKSPDS